MSVQALHILYPLVNILISIHLMCRFKVHSLFESVPGLDISIHLMCRFKVGLATYCPPLYEFQYILCVGSSGYVWNKDWSFYPISIHLMCRFKCIKIVHLFVKEDFNTSYVSVQAFNQINTFRYILFQYILCVGSSTTYSVVAVLFRYFNTSYVSVQGKQHLYTTRNLKNFNTSYVSVQAGVGDNNSTSVGYFNTSYVSVQVSSRALKLKKLAYFNTSYVSVQAFA